MPDKPTPFANTSEFYIAFGRFYAAWSRTELAIDCAMWKALGTETAEQAHDHAARTKFSDKCKQFRTLLDDDKFEHGEHVRDLLARIEHDLLRNVFAHSFLASDEHSVTFIHRRVEGGKRGKYRADAYEGSRERFVDHVQKFVQLSLEFEQAIGLSHEEVAKFASMAVPPTFEKRAF